MKPAAEKPKAATPEAKPKRILRGDDLAWGTLGLAFSLAAVAIDLVNNYRFAVKEGGIIPGCVAIAAAAGLAVVPALARKGWTLTWRALIVLCFGITAFCAIAAYADEFREKMMAAENANRLFLEARRAADDARRERDDARAEKQRAQTVADSIKENTPSAELQRLADQEDGKAEKEEKDRGGCGKNCSAAEKARDAYQQRKADAAAKEAALERVQAAQARIEVAQARIETAQGKAEGGETTHSALAFMFAERTGGDPLAWASSLSVLWSAMFIAFTLLAATRVDGALHRLAIGFGYGDEPPAPVPPAGLEVVPHPAKTALIERAAALVSPPKPDRAKRGRKPMTPEERVKKFIADELRVGEGEMTGDGMIDAFNSWSRARWPNEHPMRPRDLSQFLTKNGVERKRTGGRTRYVASPLSQPASA